VSGKTISSMEKERKVGTMEKLNTLGDFIKERKTEKADLNGKMEVSMKEISSMDTFKVMESITLQIWTSGNDGEFRMSNMEGRGSELGMTVGNMRVTSRMGRKTEKVL